MHFEGSGPTEKKAQRDLARTTLPKSLEVLVPNLKSVQEPCDEFAWLAFFHAKALERPNLTAGRTTSITAGHSFRVIHRY